MQTLADKAVFDVGRLERAPGGSVTRLDDTTLRIVAPADEAAVIRTLRGELDLSDPHHGILAYFFFGML